MILNNRKDTYDIKLSKRRVQLTGGGAARSGPADAGEKREVAAHGSEARRKDPGPGNPGGRAPRIYPGLQARAGEAAGRQRAQQGHHPRAERSHRRPQVPAGDANQLRSRSGGRRITNRGLRAPSSGRIIKPQASRSKQASSPDQASSGKRQASSDKPQATRSVIASPG